MTTGYAAVLGAEAEWLTADLSAEGYPPLLASQGGPFDAVGAEVRRLDQHRHQLWLAHSQTRQGKGSKQSVRLDHEVAAVVMWAAAGAGHRAHLDQAALAKGIESLLVRLAGTEGDRTHGGRWFNVAPATVAGATPLQLLVWTDAVAAAGAAHVVVVTWTVAEYRPS